VLKYSLTRTVEPTTEPVTLLEVKEALRVDHSNDDVDLSRLIEAARIAVERDTRRSLITQTWRLKLNGWWSGTIQIPMPPLQSVSSITYVDTAGDTQTWASTEYDVYTDDEPGVIALGYNKTFPATRGHYRDVTITYVAGYGDAETDVPEYLKRAVIEHLRMNYDGTCEQLQSYYDTMVASAAAGAYP